ncbi:hypothetical protein [Acinetobacter sp. ANC 4178]|uniref:hypothetical protein n=1 Tax=Acinetobacter sp. ANC 4178 TaxID=2529839 RepID=UPI0010397C5E|nr:hypothetical protein [Acinetobacter sp. ANC 4178]TCB67133.1 hypothetical protein E0H87_08920 [Acinetobacter sp. ANC 4178]
MSVKNNQGDNSFCKKDINFYENDLFIFIAFMLWFLAINFLLKIGGFLIDLLPVNFTISFVGFLAIFFFREKILIILEFLCKIQSKILKPFEVINDNKTEFFIWALFTLFAGQLGIITNLLIRVLGTDKDFQESLYLDAQAGNFYLYSIAIIASMLGNVFTTFLSSKEASFRYIRIIASSVLVLFLLLNAIVYSATQLGDPIDIGVAFYYSFDWLQLAFYIASMIFSIYCFCLVKLNLPKFKDLSYDDDYGKNETKEVDALTKSAVKKTSDGDLRV